MDTQPTTPIPTAPAPPAGSRGDQVGRATAKQASGFTEAANAQLAETLPFGDREDFELAQRGFIATLPGATITGDQGQVVWDQQRYDFVQGEAPPTVNPSLWRQAQLNGAHGLFRVTDRVYQVRGFDLSNMSLIEGDTGWIVVDPLISAETARAALDLAQAHLGQRPVVAVIHTHSHIDHFGGVRGIVDEADVRAGKVMIIAPEGFLHHAVSENVMAGVAMQRRAMYMYGTFLPVGGQGQVDTGLGKNTSTGTPGLIAPTTDITRTGQELTVDGVRVVFQMTPGTEAPAEMNFHLPELRAVCMAENANATLHNVYTLRGAQVRDAKAWADYLTEAIDLFCADSDVMFTSHFWPRWGRESIVDFLSVQRDLYKYLHDQTLRLANRGYTMIEIAERLRLPEGIGDRWFSRGYYGSLNHNAKAVYQRYLGWFDANPASLHALPPEEAGRKYVEFMGGADVLLARARDAFDQGEYRWVAQVVSHLVFADPSNGAARDLEADALEQLGYQAESGPWRNFYLMGALELRRGITRVPTATTSSSDMLAAMTVDMVFDFIATNLDPDRAASATLTVNWRFTDTGQEYAMFLRNCVLHHVGGRQEPGADATVVLTRPALDDVLSGPEALGRQLDTGGIRIEGDAAAVARLFAMLDAPDLWFGVVTP